MISIPTLSIIVPIYNEAESITSLHGEIVTMCRGLEARDGYTWEILFVDDGSTDGTREICESLAPLQYIRFDHNCGQTAALDRGFKAAKGEYVAALDGDGQNDPADIPAMLRYLQDHDLDMVSGWRKKRRDSFGKRAASRGAYLLRQGMVHDGIHDSGCTLKVYRRACLANLDLHAEQHRFIPAILRNRGCRIGEIEVHHRPRLHGKSKYGGSRLIRGLRDLTEIRRHMKSGQKRSGGRACTAEGTVERRSVALVVNTLSSGGAEHAVANLSRALIKAYDVDIVVNDNENIEYPFCGNIISLGMSPDADRSSPGYQLQVLRRRIAMLKTLKESGHYRAVISFSDNANLANVRSKSKGSSKDCKTIVSVRNSLAGKAETGRRFLPAQQLIVRQCCRAADKVVSCSMEIADELMEVYGLAPAKAAVIYNGVERNAVENTGSQSRKMILTVGRMTRQKGQWHLLKVLKQLRDQGLDVELTILGDGELRPLLEEMSERLGIEGSIRMPGRVSDPGAYLKNADVAVYPSLYEGCSNAILESLACGVPCISTDHRSGAREILAPDTDHRVKVTDRIDHAGYGVLVPVCPGEPDVRNTSLSEEERLLAAAVEEVLTNEEMQQAYRMAGPERAEAFDMERIAEQWVHVIEEGCR